MLIIMCLCYIAIQELEKDIEKLLVVKEKCIDAEGEVRTLKSFRVSKTFIVEKKKNEVKGDVFFMSITVLCCVLVLQDTASTCMQNSKLR